MKTARTLLIAAVVGSALAALSAPAYAHGYYRGGYYGGPRVNFSFGYWGGPGYWGPGYWGPGYWGPGYGYWGYAPPAVVVPAEPRVYVEPDQTPAPAPSSQASSPQWWYWCASAKGYYPYVSTCSEGWQRVPPQPPQAPR
jgi:hypothetical protein